MFGYVVVNKPELKFREFDKYRTYYCGLCNSLQNICGAKGQLSLSYDMTFLAMLLDCLYEPKAEEIEKRCIVHPMKKQKLRKNEMIEYVAKMNLLLTWYKCKDDYKDEKKIDRAFYAKLLTAQVDEITSDYERQNLVIKANMERLSELERANTTDIDLLSGCFGDLLGEIFAVKQDEWENCLRKIGFFMGRYIYILDAYDDLEHDRKKECFNPFLEKEKDEDFDEWVKQLLTLAAVEIAREFEKLPILQDVEILRNIIYAGIWTRYEQVRQKRMEA